MAVSGVVSVRSLGLFWFMGPVRVDVNGEAKALGVARCASQGRGIGARAEKKGPAMRGATLLGPRRPKLNLAQSALSAATTRDGRQGV